MSFSTFNLFLQKLTFQYFKNQLKNLMFIFIFSFSVFHLKPRLGNRNKHGLSARGEPLRVL
jgi:hypothetical protein